MTALFARRRPPRVRQTLDQKRALDAALRRILLTDRERAVLSVIADHSNGDGYAFLKVETIVLESGYSRASVFRALAGLCSGEDPLLERQPFLRTPGNAPLGRSRRGRQGQGPSTYRLGRVLRIAAGLIEQAAIPGSDLPFGTGDRLDETPEIRAGETAEFPRSSGRGRETPGAETPRPPKCPARPGVSSALRDRAVRPQ